LRVPSASGCAGIRSGFLWGLGFPVMSRRIARRIFSLVWLAPKERLTVVEENCLQGGKSPKLLSYNLQTPQISLFCHWPKSSGMIPVYFEGLADHGIHFIICKRG